MIPMLDLKKQYENLKAELEPKILNTLSQAHYILGEEVKEFESRCAEFLGVNHAIGVASGTDALHLALRAAGIGPGDEVITSPFSFIATAEAILYCGATPVFIDIDPKTFNLDPNLIQQAITENTKAIIPVHLYGQAAQMDSIQTIANHHNIKIIEDCAQAFGTKFKEGYVGSMGLAGCFSFYPSKNLSCFGDGGMITTNDDEFAELIYQLRNHGSKQTYHHDIIGYNSRLDAVQAVILNTKLNYINQYNSQRFQIAQSYKEFLKDAPITLPFEHQLGNHIYHQFTILSSKRDLIRDKLKENNIASMIYYPIPLHQQKALKNKTRFDVLPQTEQITQHCLSLPIYPELELNQIEQISKIISECL